MKSIIAWWSLLVFLLFGFIMASFIPLYCEKPASINPTGLHSIDINHEGVILRWRIDRSEANHRCKWGDCPPGFYADDRLVGVFGAIAAWDTSGSWGKDVAFVEVWKPNKKGELVKTESIRAEITEPKDESIEWPR